MLSKSESYLFEREWSVPGMTAEETRKLLTFIAKKAHQLVRPRHFDVMDLVTIGLMGAMAALPRWREDAGASKVSYCYRAALNDMVTEARENMGAARIPYETARRGEFTARSVDADALVLQARFVHPDNYVLAHEMLDQLGPAAATTVVARVAGYTLEEVGRTRGGVTRQAVRDQLKGRLARVKA